MKKTLAFHPTKKFIAILFILMFGLISSVNLSLAKDVTLAWDANPEPDVAGYKVYYGAASGDYTGADANMGASPIDIGNITRATLVGLDDAKSHYFTVIAYNYNGEESAYAAEVNAPPKSYDDFDADGYAITVDCDDYDPSINPGATEIPYNGVDENCNGMDDDGYLDTEAPILTIISPAAGSSLWRSVTISAKATDNVAIARMSIFIDSVWQANFNSSTFKWEWDTSALARGAHTVQVRAYDTSGNSTRQSITVYADADADQDGYDVNSDCNDNDAAINPGATEILYNGIDENCNGMDDDGYLDTEAPILTIISPAAGSSLWRNVSISAKATDNVAIARMSIFIDSVWQANFNSSTFKWKWDTSALARGAHTVQVRAYDTSGNSTRQSITVYK